MNTPNLPVKKLVASATLPTRANSTDAGLDLYSAQNVVIPPRSRLLVSTGIAVAIPVGLVGSIRPRSSLAAKYGVTVLNTPGTIDSGYRGEVKVLLFNSSELHYELGVGDRIAQLVCEVIAYTPPLEVNELPEAVDQRGAGGFGSTGK